MRYLLDELHAHENDHSNALTPISQEAERSPAGEVALMADVRVLQATVVKISASMDKVSMSQMAMSDDMRSLREQFSDMANRPPSNHCSCPGTQYLSNPSPPSVQNSNGACFHQGPMDIVLHPESN